MFEDYNQAQANTLYEEALQYYESRIKLLADKVPAGDYLLAAGINWATAISVQNENQKKSSILYIQAGDLLNFYLQKRANNNDIINFHVLILRLYSNASNLIKMTSEQKSQVLAYKATCLQSTLPSSFEMKYTPKCFCVGNEELAHTVSLHGYFFMEAAQFESSNVSLTYRYAQKAAICSLMASYFESINFFRARQLYKNAITFFSYFLGSAKEISPQYYKIIADVHWNAALMHMNEFSFEKELFEKSLELYTLWFEKISTKATVIDCQIVAEACSMMAKLYTYKSPHNKQRIQELGNKERDYYDEFYVINMKFQEH